MYVLINPSGQLIQYYFQYCLWHTSPTHESTQKDYMHCIFYSIVDTVEFAVLDPKV